MGIRFRERRKNGKARSKGGKHFELGSSFLVCSEPQTATEEVNAVGLDEATRSVTSVYDGSAPCIGVGVHQIRFMTPKEQG